MKSKVIKSLKRAKPSMNWAVWFFPIVAILITAWLAYDFFNKRGPLIELTFSDASSVEVHKTPIRFRGITVGRVENIELSEDTKEVTVFVRLTKQAKRLSVEGARFWIVQPEVDFEGVRGLETIFRGPYIRVEPGKLGAKFKDKFVGHVGEPSTGTVGGTVSYNLRAEFVDSIDIGDPVTYRGMKVGLVTEVTLDKSGRFINVQIKIEKKFVRLVRTNTVFWKKSGVQADVGLFGAEFKVGSLESLMKGGIALATPDKAGEIANAGSGFPLGLAAPSEWVKWKPEL